MKIPKWLYRKYIASVYTGRGYLQGLGIDINVEYSVIFGFEFISRIKVDVDAEWLRTLKLRIEDDERQQQLERMRSTRK